MTFPLNNMAKRCRNRKPVNERVCLVYDADGNIVANCPRWLLPVDKNISFASWKGLSRQRALDHATIIVQSCNAYPKLVLALQKIQRATALLGEQQIAEIARDALAAVGEL